jgi:type IV secretion system protein VirD4
VMAPPRTYKTAFLADVILRYPGPVIATTTKPDIHALTAVVRSQLGPVHVFNPQRIGGVRSTFRWSPVEGCQDPVASDLPDRLDSPGGEQAGNDLSRAAHGQQRSFGVV